MTVELSDVCSGESIVSVARVDIVGDNEDILAFSGQMSNDHWSLVLHTLTDSWHLLGLILELSVDFSFSFRCELSGICFISCCDCEECSPGFFWVFVR